MNRSYRSRSLYTVPLLSFIHLWRVLSSRPLVPLRRGREERQRNALVSLEVERLHVLPTARHSLAHPLDGRHEVGGELLLALRALPDANQAARPAALVIISRPGSLFDLRAPVGSLRKTKKEIKNTSVGSPGIVCSVGRFIPNPKP